MADLKTKPTPANVAEYLAARTEGQRLADCQTLIGMMREATGEEPKLWGPGLIGFGQYHYKYATGREGDWPLVGFAPRKTDLTVYIMAGFESFAPLMARLGKYKTGKSCLYLKRLADVDLDALRELIHASIQATRARYG